ncbi:b12.1 [Ichnoviriform fugitivi]|uniref:B12.1 n=1 Tax=Ichnoviriform fugitivi TaxID=265522 RepID=A2Q0E3_9VIRU|nr:b12.1 [Ichnoviriform fugitivi]BAF45658.1 b12.1 [Ichnoviriform fugitivi]
MCTPTTCLCVFNADAIVGARYANDRRVRDNKLSAADRKAIGNCLLAINALCKKFYLIMTQHASMQCLPSQPSFTFFTYYRCNISAYKLTCLLTPEKVTPTCNSVGSAILFRIC